MADMEYAPENTVLEFDVGDFFASIWIDCYYGDDEYDDEPSDDDLRNYPPEIQRNAIKCGRNIDPKEGLDGASWMFGHEYVMAGDIQELYQRFARLKSRAIDSFDYFPKHDESGVYPCLFSFAAKREPEGAMISLSFRSYSSDNDFVFHISEEKLDEVCAYFTRITEWFPPVGPDEKQVLRWRKEHVE